MESNSESIYNLNNFLKIIMMYKLRIWNLKFDFTLNFIYLIIDEIIQKSRSSKKSFFSAYLANSNYYKIYI